MTFQAVVFDLDGTLLDTLRDIADSMNGALARLGLPEHPVDAYRQLTGDGVLALITNSLPASGRSSETIERAGMFLREEYEQNWDRTTRPYEGIAELLDELIRLDVGLNILSNKMEDFTRRAVHRFLGKWPFANIIGHGDAFPRKPDPSAALHIATRQGLPASAFIYLGDTNVDMATAVAAGMFPVGALWGFRTETELVASGAKDVISRPQDLLKFFRPE